MADTYGTIRYRMIDEGLRLSPTLRIKINFDEDDLSFKASCRTKLNEKSMKINWTFQV